MSLIRGYTRNGLKCIYTRAQDLDKYGEYFMVEFKSNTIKNRYVKDKISDCKIIGVSNIIDEIYADKILIKTKFYEEIDNNKDEYFISSEEFNDPIVLTNIKYPVVKNTIGENKDKKYSNVVLALGISGTFVIYNFVHWILFK